MARLRRWAAGGIVGRRAAPGALGRRGGLSPRGRAHRRHLARPRDARPAREGVGVALIEVDPGKWSTPAHVEGASEELFYVLEGSGLSWQSGEVYEVGEGDCLVHLPHREAHTLRAGPDGLRVLAFGHRVRHGNTVLPRAGVAWMYPGFADVSLVGPGQGPYVREAAAGEPEVGEPAERPASIVNVEDVEPGEREHSASLFRRARSRPAPPAPSAPACRT